MFLQEEIAARRINRDIRTRTIMFQLAQSSTQTKEGAKLLSKSLEKLDV